MAIFELTNTEVVQRCAKCNAENRIALASLQVGVGRETRTDARVISLPECPTCQSAEFLIRSAADEPDYPAPGTFGHLHRMLVDHLHAELVRVDKVLPAIRDQKEYRGQTLARPVSQDKRDRWFPRGMKIDPALAEPQETK